MTALSLLKKVAVLALSAKEAPFSWWSICRSTIPLATLILTPIHHISPLAECTTCWQATVIQISGVLVLATYADMWLVWYNQLRDRQYVGIVRIGYA